MDALIQIFQSKIHMEDKLREKIYSHTVCGLMLCHPRSFVVACHEITCGNCRRSRAFCLERQETNMITREALTDEFLEGCPDVALPEHQAIADAIRRGDSAEHILDMPGIDYRPWSYVWLKNRLKD